MEVLARAGSGVAAGDRKAGEGERFDVKADAPVTVSINVSGVPNGVIRIIIDEGQTQRGHVPALR
ncbi:MAG: hypothetical protein HOQ06_01625 [Pseudarthrobacter sp.]|nr:hypothetical protein [Pseudarthrobacter sp.]